MVRAISALNLLEVASLAVASALHLSGRVMGRSEPFDAGHAGIAEAIIAAILLTGTIVMLSDPARRRGTGLAAIGLAIVGFANGLSMTVQGGHWPDIAYHLAVLPLLIGSFVGLLVAGRHESRRDREPTRADRSLQGS